MTEDVKLNATALDKLIKALKAKMPQISVGILGSSSRQGSTGKTNAEIGAFHEFGTSKTPIRSFLRMPLAEHLAPALKESGLFTQAVLKEVVAEVSVVPWAKKVAIVAEGVVLEAFDTGGYGKWPASDMTHKKNHQTLVETTQLRNAIVSEVKP